VTTELPDLSQSLQGRDLGHLRIIAELWGLDLNAPDARVGLQRLTPLMLESARAASIVTLLPPESRTALNDLLQNDGRLTWPAFTRRYGEVREMGPGRRDRERPYINSPSITESLWYRGLVARSFFDTPSGPEEFAFIPENLLALIPPPARVDSEPLGRPASPAEKAVVYPADDRILDHACTLLAALRTDSPLENSFPAEGALPALKPAILKVLLSAAGLLDPSGMPLSEPTRAFLECPRGEALALLVSAWKNSPEINELRLLPGLMMEGEWQNDPRRARPAVLGFLGWLPPKRPFWSQAAFVTAIRQASPDFQRPAGDYDSWYIRDSDRQEFLRGFSHWDAVDGALIRYLIAGPMHWLGLVDLAAPEQMHLRQLFAFLVGLPPYYRMMRLQACP